MSSRSDSFVFFYPEIFKSIGKKLSAPNSTKRSLVFIDIRGGFQSCLDHTSLGIGYSSDSSIRATWLILGRFSDIGSTHLRAVKSVLFNALVDGFVSRFGSITSSDRLCWTIIFSHSTKCTYKNEWKKMSRKLS